MPYTNESNAIRLHLLTAADLDAYLHAVNPAERQWIQQHQFRAGTDESLCIPNADGTIAKVLAGYRTSDPIAALGSLAQRLPAGNYQLAGDFNSAQERLLLLSWGLGHYRYGRYKNQPDSGARLYLPPPHEHEVRSLLHAHSLVRNLINTPPIDLGPAELATAIGDCAQRYSAAFTVVEGEALQNEYPAIYAVGMGSSRAPRLAMLEWGDPGHPLLCLVGKGVVFDTGGLNMKSGSRMLRMKKDMGGAAHALALAQLIMEHQLPVRVKLLVPAVENMVSGHAYRPSDIIHTRRGLTVEITNTDAEGRVVLCDALQRSGEDKPDLIIDYATLTGAARIALGPDVSPFYTNREEWLESLRHLGGQLADPLWPMPLVESYQRYLDSDVADLVNCPPTSFAGSINAALFLQHFVDAATPWVHLDIYGWNDSSRPGRPTGGEAQGLRAMFEFVRQRYKR